MNNSFLKKFSYSTVSMILVQVLQLLVIVTTSRDMETDSFGDFTIAMLIMNLGLLLSECGSGSYLICSKKFDRETLSTCLTVNVLFSVVIYGGIFLFGYLLKDYFNINILAVTLLSLSVIFLSCSQIPKSILEFRGDFELLAKCDIFSAVITFTVSIILHTFYIEGIYVLIAFSVVFSVTKTVLYFIFSNWYYYTLRLNVKIVKEIWGFSFPLVLNNLLVFFSRNNDQIIIGRLLGSSALGVYGMAMRLTIQPILRLTSILQRILLPDLSKADSLSEINEIFTKTSNNMVLILLPLSLVIYFGASDMVYVLLGGKWGQVIPIVQGTMFLPLIYALIQLAQTVLLSRSKTQMLFKIQIFSTVISVLFVFISSYLFGVNYVAPFLTFAMAMTFFIYLYYLKRELGIKFR
ncbi:oligosaccharide flippase family protein, partial [Vibrio fluvialis]